MVSFTRCVTVGNSSITCCTLNNVKTRKLGHTMQCQTGLERVKIRENKLDVMGCQKLCVKKMNFKSYD